MVKLSIEFEYEYVGYDTEASGNKSVDTLREVLSLHSDKAPDEKSKDVAQDSDYSFDSEEEDEMIYRGYQRVVRKRAPP